MAVYRVERTRDYTVMSNYHLKDTSLSLKAKGLLSMFLSFLDDWNYSTRGLAAICKEGVEAIGNTIKELEQAGYIVRRKLRGSNGRITDTEYVIYEQPQEPPAPDADGPDTTPPDTAQPDTGKPDMADPDAVGPDMDAPHTENHRSKNTALIPPGFGTPTSYLPNSGEYLTPNLVPGALSGGLVNQVGSVGNPDGGTPTNATGNGYPATSTSVDSSGFPTVDTSVSSSGGQATVAFTDVTSELYYSNGSLGTLKIPSIGLTVGVYEGTDSAALLKGAGHFEGTSIWLGNVCLAGHNRGVRNDFGKIHTLKSGDTITFTTVLGTMTYSVSSVTKVAVTDTSGLSTTADNQITLYTCVEDQPSYRWCVKAVAAS